MLINLRKEDITRITVGGFKSISQEQSIEIAPLTILAGANSSGKSSIMQPLLLLKQTLEAAYDPGALLLNGPNVKFTSADQLLARGENRETADTFQVGITITVGSRVAVRLKRSANAGFEVEETTYTSGKANFRIFTGMSRDEIQSVYSRAYRTPAIGSAEDLMFTVLRNRCFLKLYAGLQDEAILEPVHLIRYEGYLDTSALQIIHLPGLRGDPERNYPVTAVSARFPGTFENYVASVIEQWQRDGDTDKLERLYNQLTHLSLTTKVVARRKNDVEIELLVNRLRQSDKEDMVNIADVGLGVSQALPVVVALHAALPGQLVYIEQPEIHLHPRAQYAMAEVLADAAKEGKQLVVETHSSLLLLGIQTLVAEGKLPPHLVKLHWFTLNDDGSTKIDSADLDERGTFGDWAADFDDVALYSEARFLDAQARKRGSAGE